MYILIEFMEMQSWRCNRVTEAFAKGAWYRQNVSTIFAQALKVEARDSYLKNRKEDRPCPVCQGRVADGFRIFFN